MREVKALGDTAWRIRLDEGSDPAAVLAGLRALPHVIDAVVADGYALLRFDPRVPPGDPHQLFNHFAPVAVAERREHLVHVRYDGPDLSAIGLPIDRIVALHTERAYTVEVVGFMPGFAYLGPVAPELNLPRRPSPRLRVPANAVGLAAGRTAIYPFASPGGWSLIGTAVDFTPFTFQLGDRVRFQAVP